MAPTTAIETVLMIRPLKVVAMFCGILALVLLVISTSGTNWLRTDGYRQGLFEECLLLEVPPGSEETHCTVNEPIAWLRSCAALSVAGILTDFIGTVLTGVALVTTSYTIKFKLYRVAMYTFFFSLLVNCIVLIVFPIMFLQTAHTRGHERWYFDWCYGVGWGATVFVFGAAILLVVEKESEEIFYREKTYYPEDNEAVERVVEAID